MSSIPQNMMDRPQPFIETQADGKMVVNSAVVHFLSAIQSPISVISIVGKYRTGKSFLLNRFFDTNSGFSLGPTIQATTKGIWIWTRPHPSIPNHTLILLDTEGLHDVEKGDETHDMKLFSLALLLSSCLVYNATGTLDDVIIQQLHLVSELTDHIKTKESKEEDGNHFNKYFPSFFLVLRDFFLKLEINGTPCTPDQYLENALKLKKGQGKKNNDYNLPRECIQSFFPRRKCFVLCKPVDDDDMLAHLDKVSESQIKTKFLDGATHVTQQVIAEAKPFQVDGNIITASRYGQLALAYVDSINSGGIPCISSAVQLLKNNECQRAIEESVALFEQCMLSNLQNNLPVTPEEVTGVQKVAHNEALDHYRKHALFDNEGEYVKKLTEKLDNSFNQFINENNSESRKKCQHLIQEMFGGIDNAIKGGAYTGKGGFNKYKTDRDSIIKQYNSYPKKGPMSEDVLNEFLEMRKTQEYAIISADKALTEKEKELTRESEERMRQEEKAKAAASEQQRLMQQMLAQQEGHQEMLCKVQADFAQQQNRLMQEHRQDLNEKEDVHRHMLQEGLDKQANQYGELIQEMKGDKAKLEKDFAQQMEHLENFQQSHQKMIEEIKAQRESSDEAVKKMTEQIINMKENASSSNGDMGLFGIVSKILPVITSFIPMFKQAKALGSVANVISSVASAKK